MEVARAWVERSGDLSVAMAVAAVADGASVSFVEVLSFLDGFGSYLLWLRFGFLFGCVLTGGEDTEEGNNV